LVPLTVERLLAHMYCVVVIAEEHTKLQAMVKV
jgi:hypothetical protein